MGSSAAWFTGTISSPFVSPPWDTLCSLLPTHPMLVETRYTDVMQPATSLRSIGCNIKGCSRGTCRSKRVARRKDRDKAVRSCLGSCRRE